jgi:hypothetical protein
MSTIESETQKPEKKSRLFWLEKLGMKHITGSFGTPTNF